MSFDVLLWVLTVVSAVAAGGLAFTTRVTTIEWDTSGYTYRVRVDNHRRGLTFYAYARTPGMRWSRIVDEGAEPVVAVAPAVALVGRGWLPYLAGRDLARVLAGQTWQPAVERTP